MQYGTMIDQQRQAVGGATNPVRIMGSGIKPEFRLIRADLFSRL